MTNSKGTEDTLSALYHSLRARRRRYVIQFLRETDDMELSTRDLARKITSLEQRCPEYRATGEPYRNAYNALSQTHLPALSDAGIIVYDPKRQTVKIGQKFELAVLLLDIDAATVGVFYSLQSLSNESGDNNNGR